MHFLVHIELTHCASKITKYLFFLFWIAIRNRNKRLKKSYSEIKTNCLYYRRFKKSPTKIGIIKNLIPKFDNIIIVGAMANNILNHKGNKIGKSIFEKNCEDIINDIFRASKITIVKLHIQRTY